MDVAVFDGHVPMVSNCRAAWSSICPGLPCHVVPDADTIQVHRSFMAGLSIIDDIRFCMIIRAVFDRTLAGCLIVLNDTVFDIRISVVHNASGNSEVSVLPLIWTSLLPPPSMISVPPFFTYGTFFFKVLS